MTAPTFGSLARRCGHVALLTALGCAGRSEPAGVGSGGSGGSGGYGMSSGGVSSGEKCSPEGAVSASNGCNSCTCSGGTWVCTHSVCPVECKAGQTMQSGCNSCTCHDGQWACTALACYVDAGSGQGGSDGGLGNNECLPGQTKTIDCNTCSCAGGMWACTRSVCVSKACGARAGNTCSATEYCAYKPGELCGASDAEATCQPRPETCDQIYMPVCGCDFKTYPSACDAAQRGQGVNMQGMCPVP